MTTSDAFKSLALKQALNTAIPSPRKSPTLVGAADARYSSNQIREDMSQSPKSIRVTDKRVDFLVKAKQTRRDKA